MSLKAILAEHPAAKQEHDEAVNQAFIDGQTKLRAELTKVSKFYGKYNSVIDEKISACISGEVEPGAVELLVSTEDMRKEREASDAATSETAAQGETTSQVQSVPDVPANGSVETEEQFQALLAKRKAEKGGN